MRVQISLALLVGMIVTAGQAGAYEYKLQFTPNPGYRGLVVAGYGFDSNDNVVGNCSYNTVHSGSGRGGGYKTVTTYYNQTCTWDPYGNLLGVAQGAPAAPVPLYTSGTLTVYASNSFGDTTGIDSRPGMGGFVNTPGSHYTWQTSNAYQVIPQALDSFTATLASDGDVPLNISAAQASVLKGKVTVNGKACLGTIAVGATCNITVTYDPTRLFSPTGLAYDTLTLTITSDSGQTYDFVQSYTIQLNPSHSNDSND